MALVLPVGYFNVQHRFRVTGVADEFGFSIAFAPALGEDAQSIATAAHLAYSASDMGTSAVLSSETFYLGTSCTEQLVSGPTVADVAVSIQGTRASLGPPVNCALLVSKFTAAGGRKNRGRVYLPAGLVNEGAVDGGGFINTANVTALQAQMDDWFIALTTSPLAPVLLHSDPADTPTPVNNMVVQAQIATQRKRMR